LKVKVGQDASFTCSAPGQDDVDITWLRADRKLFTGTDMFRTVMMCE